MESSKRTWTIDSWVKDAVERLVLVAERWIANQEAAERRERARLDGKQLRALTDYERIFMGRKEGDG